MPDMPLPIAGGVIIIGIYWAWGWISGSEESEAREVMEDLEKIEKVD